MAGALMLYFLDTVVAVTAIRRKMAQRFRRHVHVGRASMKYSRRSKRGGRRKAEVKCIDASMVRNKEDFMKIIGLDMKNREEEDAKNRDRTVEKKNDSSTANLRIRECSVVIVGENCKICGLLFKSISDVIFHTEMRHGNGFNVCGKYIEGTISENKETGCVNVPRRRRRSNNNNNNGNQLRVKLKIGDEIISEISMNRKHLKIHAPADGTDEAARRWENGGESIALKNDYKSSIVGIDSFVSSKNHCDDYVMSVQPLNRTHQRAPRNSPLLLQESQHDGNSNYIRATRRIEDSSPKSIGSLLERLPRWSLQEDHVICNSKSNNKNNNNKNSNVNMSPISECCNMSDKENESTKTQSMKNVTDVTSSVQSIATNLPPRQSVSDDDDIQEILRITRRRRSSNHANIKRKLDYPVNEEMTLSDSEEEFVNSTKKVCWSTYSTHEILV